ncbi:Zn(II)2Cys6 transcription factor [Aspergillus stella-maris]|uniref:Zn(II)2Cys6 transcription factor n=1 Tax=Aspergillus stella-maris TaxID=1810926 RepID=UPI003CCCADE7
MPRPSKLHIPSPRIRAGKACKRCNLKRIKCGAILGTPCRNCVRAGEADCVLRPTRRGTYVRKKDSHRGQLQDESDREPPKEGVLETTAPAPMSINPVGTATLLSPTHTAVIHPARLQDSSQPTSNGSSYRDISWSGMFEYFINSRNGRSSMDKCSITYLGETFPLAIVLDDLEEGADQCAPAHMSKEDLDYLQIHGVFDVPDKSQLDGLVSVFLDRVYPAYPIVNRHELIAQHEGSEVPLILLYSICFIAATFCPLSLLHQTGYSSRKDARSRFHRRVKLLFDSGFQIDKIVILQSAICMTFWGGGPNSYWNFYSWLSTAVTIAEAMGIHRSTATTNMHPHDQSLLRRLWWILVVRDTSCSTLVGRPFRIDVKQADTEMLTLNDLAHDAPCPEALGSATGESAFAYYQIEIAKLCLIVHDIVNSCFAPGGTRIVPESCHQRLRYWRECLPANLRWNEHSVTDIGNAEPFTMALMAQYYDKILLLYLGQGHDRRKGSHLREDFSDIEEITDAAAQQISDVACIMVTRSLTLLVPHEFFHRIFLAQATFYMKLRSPQRLVAQLGRSALNNCQMVLHESLDCWDPSLWIMQLFDGLSNRLTDSRQRTACKDPEIDINGMDQTTDSTPEAGVFSNLLGYEPWQSNPMLSTLSDMPFDMLLPQ